MEPWYKVVTPRREVREGRSFNPDEFAIALEQVVAGTAPEDYREPEPFFARTCWTRALREHAGMVLRRLAGRTDHTAPVLTLITQFGGGKTHTLTTLYHLARRAERAMQFSGVPDLLREAGVAFVPGSRVGVFVGNAWDPQPGRETPWIDLARQVAGEAGVEALGPAAHTTPPGTEALGRVFRAAAAPVLLLFDEVLNFLNRHRSLADSFHAFLQNLTVATTGAPHTATVISLPRSQVEMTDWDLQWQERITKVVRRVAKDLIVNEEAEISEVVRRRLFEDLGPERVRRKVAREYADWVFERRAQLPPAWTVVDAATTDTRAREHLRQRFEACYPFHPATLSVFQHKWQALPQYQQTRGTLAMLAQWIGWAYRTGIEKSRNEPLITLGSAPLFDPAFRGVVLGQLGESRLVPAIEADLAGELAHTRALDADTKGALRDLHRRVGTAIFFESCGGQSDKVAHLPELRFALGEPQVDTTSVDNAAFALESRAYFIRKVGADGFRILYKPTFKKVVNDRRASLDEATEVLPTLRQLVREEFQRATTLPVVPFPREGAEIPDSPRLTLVLVDPEQEWTGADPLRGRLAEWTRQRDKSPRLYPGALVWCLKKPGRDLRDKVELWLAWQRVAREVDEGTLGGEYDRNERADLQAKLREAREAAREEVWASYRFVVVAEATREGGLRPLDLGAGHSSSGETLCGRIIATLKSEELLNDSVGAGYLDRNWPPALKESGAWPLASLRQCFLNGTLPRLLDPDTTLRGKIVEFVGRGDFGLASHLKPDGTFERVWFQEPVSSEELAFEADVFLLTRARARALKSGSPPPAPPLPTPPGPGPGPHPPPTPPQPPAPVTPPPPPQPPARKASTTLRLEGALPPEHWNRFGTKILPRLRAKADLKVKVDLSVTVSGEEAGNLETELSRALEELGLTAQLTIREE